VRCPACENGSSKVVDSRPGLGGAEIRRRRECDACSHRFTTWERIESVTPLVVKRDARREPFDPDKIRRSLLIACRKRPVSADAIERIVHRTASRVEALGEREVSSESIGGVLLDELKAVDPVSYARFASVYRRFETLDEFAQLVRES